MPFTVGFHFLTRLLDTVASMQHQPMGFHDTITSSVCVVADVCEIVVRTECSGKCTRAHHSAGGHIVSVAFTGLCWRRRHIRMVCVVNGTLGNSMLEFGAFGRRQCHSQVSATIFLRNILVQMYAIEFEFQFTASCLMHSHRRHRAWATIDAVAIKTAFVCEEHRSNATIMRYEISTANGDCRRTDILQCSR